MKGNDLILQFEQGVVGGWSQQIPVYFYHEDNLIATLPIQTISGEVHFYTGRRDFVIGEEFTIKADIPEEHADITISDKEILEYMGNYTFRAIKEGKCTVSCKNKWSNKTASIIITVKDMIVDAYMSYSFDWGSMWDVQLVGEVRGKDITKYTTCFVDENRSIQTPLNKMSGSSDGTDYLKNDYFFTIIAQNKEELEYKISKFTFHAEGTKGGKKFSVKTQVRAKK